ncbi:ABC transporter ATP-binding protein [Methylomarinum vadi]|uniref:ABC transporter ATP-binding protein n=1 Tax=Methylomarinum vadi TaxID=438855 RepID=UPI0004DEE275|nr:ABC transporter ATP-binding protein [Methylomarinum vadi]
MTTQHALEISELSFAYGSKKALDEVGFSVEVGECTMLLGPNGAGKSTLFSLITRLYDSRQGSIKLCGYDVRKDSRKALAQLGVVFQQSTLDPDLTVLQNLRYHSALHGIGRKQANRRIQEELERFEMYDRRKEKVRQLNGGHRRRVEIARALLHQPKLLLLDEPTVGLDVPSRHGIVEHVHKLVEETDLAVLWATHLIDEIYPEDQLIILHKGRVMAKSNVERLLEKTGATIHEVFSKLTRG